MYTYIKNSLTKHYFVIEEELDPNLFNVGTTFDDYLNGKYVLLSEEQCTFRDNNPTASLSEIFSMSLREETLEEVKSSKINEITMYDSSKNVNVFYYNNTPFWLDKETRVGLMNSTTILKNAGEENTTLWLGEVNVTIPCDTVINMLGLLEIYALNCYNVTAEHKSQVNALTTIEEVNAFDITAGYPDKIYF